MRIALLLVLCHLYQRAAPGVIPSEAKAPWKSLNEKMAKVSIELDGVAISCANRGAVSALPSKIADTNCFSVPWLYVLIGTKVGKITGFTEENARFVEFF